MAQSRQGRPKIAQRFSAGFPVPKHITSPSGAKEPVTTMRSRLSACPGRASANRSIKRRGQITPDLQARLWPYLGGISHENRMKALEVGAMHRNNCDRWSDRIE